MKNLTATFLPTILTFTLSFLFSLTTNHPLSPLYLPTLLTPTRNQTTPQPTLQCFTTSDPIAQPLNLTDCETTIDLLIHDPAGAMNPQTFSWHAHVPHSFGVPAEWALRQCQIMLTTSKIDVVDEFRLVDVAVEARRVLDECFLVSKFGLGGLALVGNDKGYFVAVNGPEPGEE
ncbi:hypothetical protein BDR22DRAFT_964057 [Usnea florida]